MKWLPLALAPIALSASAQELPPSDPRIQLLTVVDSTILPLSTAPDTAQTLLFRQGERISSIILSDPTAFTIEVAGSGDSLSLRAARPSAFGIMNVRTSLRTYDFQLTSAPGATVPPVVRLVDPAPSRPSSPALTNTENRGRFAYRLNGSKALQPTSISDDGAKTYIEWGHDQTMPATFALGPTGSEQMVDGYMRGGIYTIDRVYKTLIFRIDKQHAQATRREIE